MKILCIVLPILSLTPAAHGRHQQWSGQRRGRTLKWINDFGNGEDAWTEDAFGPFASTGNAYGGNGGGRRGRGGYAQSGQAYGRYGSRGKAVRGRDGQHNQWVLCNGHRCEAGDYRNGDAGRGEGHSAGSYGGAYGNEYVEEYRGDNVQDQVLEPELVPSRDIKDTVVQENDPGVPLTLDQVLPEGIDGSLGMRGVATSGSNDWHVRALKPVLIVAYVFYVIGSALFC